MRNPFTGATVLDRIFWISLILKGLDGALEIIGGVLLLLVSPHQIGVVVQLLTQHELSEDPHDLIANGLLHLTSGLSSSATLFGAFIVVLTWREYGIHRARRDRQGAARAGQVRPSGESEADR